MLEFIVNYGGSIAVGAAVLAVVALIVAGFVKDRRAGGHSCGGDCGSCRNCTFKTGKTGKTED